MLAGALEAKLAAWATRGREAASAPSRSPAQRGPRDEQADTKRAAPRTNVIDLPLDRLPTEEEIAAEVRRRPIGAVIVDICRDLGIRPADLPGQQWRELFDAVVQYGGNLITLIFKEGKAELMARLEALYAGDEAAWAAAYAHAVPARGTGPP